jgi:hemolysin III
MVSSKNSSSGNRSPASRQLDREVPTPREQSLGEEIANSVSHGLGLVATLVAAPVLLVAAFRHGDAWSVIGASVFSASMLLLYVASTLYHALPQNKAKDIFRLLDHSAVFLLIAGTYTPFTLGVLRGPWGWTLLVLVWTLAIAGVAMKALIGTRRPWISMVLYLGMGWLALVAVKPIWLHVPLAGIAWVVAGGLAYTGGLVFFSAHRVRYSHFVWHIFVMAGTTCHFVAALWYSR